MAQWTPLSFLFPIFLKCIICSFSYSWLIVGMKESADIFIWQKIISLFIHASEPLDEQKSSSSAIPSGLVAKPVLHISGSMYMSDLGAWQSNTSAFCWLSDGFPHTVFVCRIVALIYYRFLPPKGVAKVIHYPLSASFWRIFFARMTYIS